MIQKSVTPTFIPDSVKLAHPEFGVSGKRLEREMDSLLLWAPPDLKT